MTNRTSAFPIHILSGYISPFSNSFLQLSCTIAGWCCTSELCTFFIKDEPLVPPELYGTWPFIFVPHPFNLTGEGEADLDNLLRIHSVASPGKEQGTTTLYPLDLDIMMKFINNSTPLIISVKTCSLYEGPNHFLFVYLGKFTSFYQRTFLSPKTSLSPTVIVTCMMIFKKYCLKLPTLSCLSINHHSQSDCCAELSSRPWENDYTIATLLEWNWKTPTPHLLWPWSCFPTAIHCIVSYPSNTTPQRMSLLPGHFCAAKHQCLTRTQMMLSERHTKGAMGHPTVCQESYLFYADWNWVFREKKCDFQMPPGLPSDTVIPPASNENWKSTC